MRPISGTASRGKKILWKIMNAALALLADKKSVQSSTCL